jgi:hypothetical protein
LKPNEAEALPRIYGMILEGNTRPDIEAAAPSIFPGIDVPKVIDHALARFASVADEPPDVIGGWCLESSRDLYRKMVEVGDYAGALRAVKQVTETAKFIRAERRDIFADFE